MRKILRIHEENPDARTALTGELLKLINSFSTEWTVTYSTITAALMDVVNVIIYEGSLERLLERFENDPGFRADVYVRIRNKHKSASGEMGQPETEV